MMELEDGKGVWQRNLDLPWNEYKLLQRDKFEELVTMMIDAYPCLLYTSDAADE